MSHPQQSGRPLKVAIICHSDLLGGASIVTYRLMAALRDAGVDARMVVFNKYSEDPSVEEGASRLLRGTVFFYERLGIALRNGFSRKNLFKVSTASTGLPVHNHPWVKEADVILLSWINQGLLSLRGIERLSRLGKPIVWTMHDMWCLTGICHHARECRAYFNECGHCQFLTGGSSNDLSRSVFLKKQKLFDRIPITFVAVSNWLAGCSSKSRLLGNRDVRVIPNAFPIDSFFTHPTTRIERLVEAENYILMGAARLDDPIKGLPAAIEALNYLFDNRPDIAKRSQVVFFGALGDSNALAGLRFPFQHLGTINDPNTLRQLYARSKVVLSSSLYETLPGTLIEGLASGALPVSFGRGGQADIIDHKVNGYIAEYGNHVDFARGIVWAIESNPDREALHEDIRRRFSASAVASRYLDLFDELLGNSSD
ncbi:MAG: glycosyltransferase [Paramuribaculum sp.]|nr:glycosyltransferase [Paramuribaculum sp.]MDE6323698.1 glycosyltransferase [Paramuribaculum sp.]MDE6487690.1 glycosyltransferase [Paramuribaculum sp.]